jgi:hypothetical protein
MALTLDIPCYIISTVILIKNPNNILIRTAQATILG